MTSSPKIAHGKEPQSEASLEDVRLHRDIAALSYVWILSVIIYIMRRESPFVRFHAKQAMILFGLSIPAWYVPFIGHLLELILLGLMVLGFLNAAQGQWRDVPVVGALSRGETNLRLLGSELLRGLRHFYAEATHMVREEWRHRSGTQAQSATQTEKPVLAESAKPPMLGTDEPPSSPHP